MVFGGGRGWWRRRRISHQVLTQYAMSVFHHERSVYALLLVRETLTRQNWVNESLMSVLSFPSIHPYMHSSPYRLSSLIRAALQADFGRETISVCLFVFVWVCARACVLIVRHWCQWARFDRAQPHLHAPVFSIASCVAAERVCGGEIRDAPRTCSTSTMPDPS